MGLLDKFKRKSEVPSDGASAPDDVAAARVRARRRLIGATVLLAAGIIGFPLLFETQPRPIPVDVPIEIPQKDKAPPLVLSPAPGASTVAAAPLPAPPDSPERAEAPAVAPSQPTKGGAPAPDVITERAEEQGREVAPKASAAGKGAGTAAVLAATGAAAVVAAQAVKPASKPHAAASAPAAASKPAAKPVDKAADAQRAQALLDGKPAAASAAASTRIVVQAGAYTDATKLREARAKVEKLGFKTYTQVVDGEGGKRTRVRVGPFATKAEADKAAAKLRAAGLQANLLTL